MKVDRVKGTFNQVLQALDNWLTINENLQATIVDVTTPDTADTEFEVHHTLGRTPTTFLATVDQNAVVYGSRILEWNKSSLFLKCSQPTVQLRLVVL